MSSTASAKPGPVALPHKEQSLFKQILRQYEHKQYKKGLKNADSILKKYPDHGETLAMRGLFLSHLDQKPEAYECVKRGLKCHLQSPICWHVYGLLYRMDKNYEEAMKCYRFALKFDKDNLQVLRDFSYLQVHLRDFEGYCDTESRLLHLRPGQRSFWIGLAVGYHLRGMFSEAVKVIDAYLDTEVQEGSAVLPFAKRSAAEKFEHSEMVLYKIEILYDSGDWLKALDQLKRIKNEVVDLVGWLEIKARLFVKLEKVDDARKTYLDLLDYNADRKEYIQSYLDTFKITQAEDILKELDVLLQRYPRSNVLKHWRMKHSIGDAFRDLVSDYLKAGLRKGVPSLFVSLKSLCSSDEKESVIVELCKSFLENYNANGSFESTAQEEKELVTVYPWLQYLLAQIHSAQGMHETALAHINAAIEHSPTLLELYMMKARIYKRAGDPSKAAHFMNEARLLDLQDRFINTKAAKYYIRNNEIAKAEEIIALFLVRTGDTAEKLQDLVEMQCMWFALECAASYEKQGLLGLALKKYHQISKHFVEITDDQFDFHTYCLRKMTIRSYLDLLRLEDNLHEHKFYLKAAEGAVRCYLKLHANPKLVEETLAKQAGLVKPAVALSDEERKKKEAKERKEAARQQAEAKEKADKDKDGDKDRQKDDDPHGTKQLEFKDALAEAQSFLRPLQLLQSKWVLTHVYTFDILIQQKKWQDAYKSLCTARSIDAAHHQVHRITTEFMTLLFDNKEVAEALGESLKDDAVFTKKSLDEIVNVNETYLTESIQAKNLAGLRIATVLRVKLVPSESTSSLKTLSTTTVQILKGNAAEKVSISKTSLLPELIAIYDYLCSTSDAHHLTLFKKECHGIFPLASIFSTEQPGSTGAELADSIASLAISE